MLKRALFAFTTLLFLVAGLFVLTPKIARAQEDPVNALSEEFDNRRRGDQMNLETWYSGKVTDDPADPASIGFSDIILLDLYDRVRDKNIDFSNPTDAIRQLLTKTRDNPLALLEEPLPNRSGLIAQLGGVIGKAYSSPPVSFSEYLASVRQNIEKKGVVQPAYAQETGYGFNSLLPILPIWKAFRNVAYFVFILVFVLYGFMIMFRMKINPQNVATFQTAIPKIVTTLLLITFAYAIAGFMIDIMFVIFNLILSVFQASGIIGDPNHLAIKLGSGQAGILGSFLFSLFTSIAFVPPRLISVLVNAPTAVGFITDIILTATGLGLIIRIIIIIAIGYSYVKLIFKLFEAYITIIIQVIFSPLILLQDVLPGSQAFGNWVRNIAAHLSVFPVSMIMFLLSYIFMVQPLASIGFLGIGEGLSGVQNLQQAGSTGLNLPLIGVGGGTDSSAILVVVGFFIILMASKYVDMVRDALKVPPFKYGGALGEALGYGWGQFTNPRSLYSTTVGSRVAAGIDTVSSTSGGIISGVTGRRVSIPTTEQYRDTARNIKLRA